MGTNKFATMVMCMAYGKGKNLDDYVKFGVALAPAQNAGAAAARLKRNLSMALKCYVSEIQITFVFWRSNEYLHKLLYCIYLRISEYIGWAILLLLYVASIGSSDT